MTLRYCVMARLVLQRDLMSEEDFRRIQQNTDAIEEILDPKSIVGILFSKEIIDRDEMDELSGSGSRQERARMLISKLLNRGPRAFQIFISALLQKGYEQLAAKLTGSEESAAASPTQTKIEDKIEELCTRITNIEKYTENSYLTQKELKDSLSKEVQTIKEITKKIHHLASSDSLLKQQLEEKEALLSSARQKIEALEDRIKELEIENESLKQSVARVERTAQGAIAHSKTVESRCVALEKKNKRLEDGQRKTDKEVQALTRQMQMLFHPKETNQATKQQSQKLTPRNRFENTKK